jgi:hypothetical protein
MLDCAKKPDLSISYGLKVKNNLIMVLLDSRSTGALIFIKKGSIKYISVVKRAVPQSWGFNTDKVGDIKISFLEYSTSKKVCLQLDIVEYDLGGQVPMYDLIIGKQTLHSLEVGVALIKSSKIIY